jgi:hypothetical protein
MATRLSRASKRIPIYCGRSAGEGRGFWCCHRIYPPPPVCGAAGDYDQKLLYPFELIEEVAAGAGALARKLPKEVELLFLSRPPRHRLPMDADPAAASHVS